MRRRAARVSLVTAALVAPGAPARADEWGTAEVEPVTFRTTAAGFERNTVAFASATVSLAAGRVAPYAGVGAGLFTIAGRLGLRALLVAPHESGPILRAELRPALFAAGCAEPALLGQVGFGYRFALEYRRPDEPPPPGLLVVPAVEGGVAWLRRGCGEKRAVLGAPRPELPLGGTLALALEL